MRPRRAARDARAAITLLSGVRDDSTLFGVFDGDVACPAYNGGFSKMGRGKKRDVSA